MSDTSGATPPSRLPGTGWRPDARDRRDRALYRATPDIRALPDEVNLETLMPPVMDQSVVGACVGYSAANVAYAVMVKDGHRRPFVPSPVFIYREARVLGGYVEEDAGTEIRLAWKAMNKLGLPPMSNLPPRFRPTDLPDAQTWVFPENSVWRRQPAKSHYADAGRRQVLGYFRAELLEDVLQSLADGYPVQIGIPIFRSFYGSGGPLFDIPDPAAGERDLGGHAVTAIGYSKANQRVLCRNQWGEAAHQGTPNFQLSWRYMRDFAGDCWTARTIAGGRAAA